MSDSVDCLDLLLQCRFIQFSMYKFEDIHHNPAATASLSVISQLACAAQIAASPIRLMSAEPKRLFPLFD
ncbi:hypothetical protein M3197_17255, partial [Sporosarcina aquimarina]|nr:hypothetical protein [Sporosarcina aquimarina]